MHVHQAYHNQRVYNFIFAWLNTIFLSRVFRFFSWYLPTFSSSEIFSFSSHHHESLNTLMKPIALSLLIFVLTLLFSISFQLFFSCDPTLSFLECYSFLILPDWLIPIAFFFPFLWFVSFFCSILSFTRALHVGIPWFKLIFFHSAFWTELPTYPSLYIFISFPKCSHSIFPSHYLVSLSFYPHHVSSAGLHFSYFSNSTTPSTCH